MYMRTAKAQISQRIHAIWSGPSLSADRIIGYYRMYEWRAKAPMVQCIYWNLSSANETRSLCKIIGHWKYHIYPKYSDTSTPYHICSKIWTSTIHYQMLCLKIAGWVANNVDPDETPHSAASHLGLYCLLRPVCLNTYGKYGNTLSEIGSPHGFTCICQTPHLLQGSYLV